MTITLVIPEAVSRLLADAVIQPLETAGVLLAQVVIVGGEHIRLLAREYHPVADSAYLRREVDGLTIDSAGYVPALARAEELGAMAIWLHTHPGSGANPHPSLHDVKVDSLLAEPFRLRSGSDFYGALILSPTDNGFCFTGHMESEGRQAQSIDRIWVVGDRFALTSSVARQAGDTLEMFDRNVRAFGAAVQNTLSNLTIGIVGCGGTGSAVAEQLVRLGVRNFVLLDPDTLSESNLTRVIGSTVGDVGRLKVDVISDHLKTIAPDAQCKPIASMLTINAAAQQLLCCDVVFGCSDDNAGRLILSRLPTYLLTPVIDCGVLLSSDSSNQLTGIHGRVTTVVPGQACLLCRDRIDVARAAAEMMTPEERRRLENEGYAPALGRIEPAVVTFTSMVAATAVSELLERLIGYGPEPRPTEVLLRCHDREISTNIATPRLRHYCHPQSNVIGRGMTEPFLDMAWPK
ncbi:ThiF family adenylyltransferase [Pelomonas sp. SE-A7]|uniref:HesA/MoeB/ThiF family protein n=1 Tax=Pelomonas sp. SE-A7 TaxID=3054953 RepID=UPI00259CABE7|nr:ThiF family adenylyltransferase [Pelomonas sp. SE-A7]MDM4768269.1 ThiF family adenylyltransferase [Pelomonas sp. SE-A7]